MHVLDELTSDAAVLVLQLINKNSWLIIMRVNGICDYNDHEMTELEDPKGGEEGK